MSTLHNTIEIQFKNRKPSRAVIMRTLAEYLKQGGKSFALSYGENWIDILWHDKAEQWTGTGWIKDIGGDDIAQELNQLRKQAIKELREAQLNDWNYVGSIHHY